MRMFIVMFLTTVFLAASFQISTAKELDGLLVYFAFEDGTGETVTDLSGNGQDGLLVGDTAWTRGKYGKGLNFGG